MRIRRRKPSTDEERKRATELRRILANNRASKAEKEAAQIELDALAPIEADGRTPAQRERRGHYLSGRLSGEGGLSPSRRARFEQELADLNGSPLGITREKVESPSNRSPVAPPSTPAAAGNSVQNLEEYSAGLVPGTYEHDGAIAWLRIPATPEVRAAAANRYWLEFEKRETERMLADPARRRKRAAWHIAKTKDNKWSEGLIWEILCWNRGFPLPDVQAKWAASIFAEVDRRDSEDPEWFHRVLNAMPKADYSPEVRALAMKYDFSPVNGTPNRIEDSNPSTKHTPALSVVSDKPLANVSKKGIPAELESALAPFRAELSRGIFSDEARALAQKCEAAADPEFFERDADVQAGLILGRLETWGGRPSSLESLRALDAKYDV